MQAAILQVEERFMARQGLPSPALVNQVKEHLRVHTVREALASEPAVLPPHKRRGIWALENGEIIQYQRKTRTERTKFMRCDYNAHDVDLLQRIVEAQTQTFRFEDTMRLKDVCNLPKLLCLLDRQAESRRRNC